MEPLIERIASTLIARHQLNTARYYGKKDRIPVDVEGVMPVMDQSLLYFLNRQAAKIGLAKPFHNPTKCKSDNKGIFCQSSLFSRKQENGKYFLNLHTFMYK